MTAAFITFITGMMPFYNTNDTVPFISMIYRCVFVMLCVRSTALSGLCAIMSVRSGKTGDRIVLIVFAYLFNALFAGICLIVSYYRQWMTVMLYLLANALITGIHIALCGKLPDNS